MSISRAVPKFVLAALLVTGALVGLPATGQTSGIEKTTNGITVRSASETLHIGVCSPAVIHVVASAASEIPNPVVPVVTRPCRGAKFSVKSTSAMVSVETTILKVDIDRGNDSVRFLAANGDSILSEQANDGRELNPVDIRGTHTYRVLQRFLLSPGESLYGLGQHQEGFFDIRDIPIRLLQANTNIAIPFLVSNKGYGLLWNNPSLTDFNPATEAIPLDAAGAGTFHTGPAGEYGFLLTGNYRRKLRLAVNGKVIIDLANMWVPESASGKMHLDANSTYSVLAESGGDTHLFMRRPADAMSFSSQAAESVDYYLMYGPQPSSVISEYREFTGSAPLLPRWAYGFWQCRERYSNQQQILDTANDFRSRKIPVDVLVQDWQYWGKYGWNAMRFDETNYPNPKEMLSELHRKDLHMVISVWAKFGTETAVNDKFKEASLLLRDVEPAGDPPNATPSEDWADLFDPQAQKLYWSEIDDNLFRLGLDGWWLDASEPEGDPLKDDMTNLGPGKVVRNAYPLYETSAVYQGQRAADPSKRVVILSRSAFAGQQRNGSISWSGDISANWDTLRRQIPAGLSFAMSGMPYWTTDIGGFFRPRDQYTSPEYHELLTRWFEFGAFCPIFRIHGYQSKTEMWNYGPGVEKVLTEYDQLRYRLLPYIYSSAWGVTERGEIMMKALPFVYPSQRSLRDISDEFFFGDSLLVSPVTTPNATSRSVVLPAGDDWVDFWTGRSYYGGQRIDAAAPLDRIPIFVKEGSIVPLGPVVQSTAQKQDPLEIRIYRGRDGDFLLYQDAGDGYAYEEGAKATTQLHWDDRSETLSIGNRTGAFSGMDKRQTLQIVLVEEGHGTGIESESAPNRNVVYDGASTKVRFGR